VLRFLEALEQLTRDEGQRLLWVLGIDMSHMGRRYGDSFSARAAEGEMAAVARRDRERIERLVQGDAEGFWTLVQEGGDPLKWCGSAPCYAFLRATGPVAGELLRYDQWNIDDDSVVSFAGMAFRRATQGAGEQRARELIAGSSLMATEVRDGLTASRPWLPPKYLYDDRGSELFEEITRLPEYYQTRTEETILEEIADEVVRDVAPHELVELGSGAGRKIRLLLEAMRRGGLLRSCALFDINELFVSQSAQRLAAAFPEAAVRGIVGDFHSDLGALGPGGGRLVIFLGGTIGNLEPGEVPPFSRSLARQLEPGDAFLVGVDLVKDEARLHAAYNDSAGVSAAFTLNVLQVLNDRLDADFDLSAFEHVATWEPEMAWIRLRVRATRRSRVCIPGANLELTYEPGDEIQTEVSCKYTRASLEDRLAGSGLRLERWFADRDELFALALLRR